MNLSSEDIIALLVIAILVIFVYRGCRSGSEHMGSIQAAPLDFGTFKNNYPRGKCASGNLFAKSDCQIGNCNLGTTVSDQQYCMIQCAQDPDPQERETCYARCIEAVC